MKFRSVKFYRGFGELGFFFFLFVIFRVGRGEVGFRFCLRGILRGERVWGVCVWV